MVLFHDLIHHVIITVTIMQRLIFNVVVGVLVSA
jgi:hypothetical protein